MEIIGRILLGGFFLITGVNHFMKIKMMTSYSRSKKVPSPRGAVIVTGLMLIIGGLGIILVPTFFIIKPLLILFLLPTSFIMHDFWKENDKKEKMEQMLFFMYNMALIGALLLI